MPAPPKPLRYRVWCRADDDGGYVIATSRMFTAEEAAEYARTIAASRVPRVLREDESLDAEGRVVPVT